MKRIITILTILTIATIAQSIACFAADPIETKFNEYGAVNQKFKYKTPLNETTYYKGSIISFDISESGKIAVLLMEQRPKSYQTYLLIYDNDMNLLKAYESLNLTKSVKFEDNNILIFKAYYLLIHYSYDGEMLDAYELSAIKGDEKLEENYSEYIYRNEVKIGDDSYYLTNDMNKKPESLANHDDGYRYLIKEDSSGNQKVLLERKETTSYNISNNTLSLLFPITLILLIYFSYLNLKNFKKKRGTYE